MPRQLTIRAERSTDCAAIGEVINAAFSGMPYAAGDEAELVEVLRRNNALCVSLVAALDGAIVGQIAFSRAQPSDGAPGWYALGPVAVLPVHQGEGIGSKLVWEGLRAIADVGANGCILTGNPAYYSRFGFTISPSNAPAGEPAEFFMIKSFVALAPVGPIFFHEAFNSAA
jgi:predicted N-acetyltransferase YhbS